MELAPWLIVVAVLAFSAWSNRENRKFVIDREEAALKREELGPMTLEVMGKALDQMSVSHQASIAAIRASVHVGGQPKDLIEKEMEVKRAAIAASEHKVEQMGQAAVRLPSNGQAAQVQSQLMDRLRPRAKFGQPGIVNPFQQMRR